LVTKSFSLGIINLLANHSRSACESDYDGIQLYLFALGMDANITVYQKTGLIMR
jgi:hypothetical protein